MNTQDTQDFFSDVVNGIDSKFKPSKPYQYEYNFSETELLFKSIYDDMKGNFDDHIATSIPTFRDMQIRKGVAICKAIDKTSSIIDIGGSEGGFVKTIGTILGDLVHTVNLDPNVDMKIASDRHPRSNHRHILEAFYEGFDDYPKHIPKTRYDIVHESMCFQFIQPDRIGYLLEIKANYLKPGGLFITEEKFKLDSQEQYKWNEERKNKYHKLKYYTPEQLSQKSEHVLTGMEENQASYTEYVNMLRNLFYYVHTYWTAGNFRGIVATNNEEMFHKFLNHIER